MVARDVIDGAAASAPRTLVYRQSAWTRATHWIWAASLFFLLLSGLQIFNAHPTLYIGDQSGFEFDNSVLSIGAQKADTSVVGVTKALGLTFDTTGLLGVSGERAEHRAFPAWATIPSYRDLGTGRVVHFFFAWVLVATLGVWLVAGILNGHLRRDLVPRLSDMRALPRDLADHLKLKFHHTREYNTLQKLAYAGILFVLLPLMIATGLAMSPGANALMPWLPELLGGRQTARTIHFVAMLLLVGFFVIHMLMIVAAGPINEMRSIVTGWYRIDRREPMTGG
ncbi:cytochrome b/b6 domain-containing protein [Arvimicrobium flavum]|uniref:cytochrome b/b6 domain-containing protein n=1 Tax=Arvimicrobium flavum TaxID=3393320 RepID=UPI00237A5057|nr:cytochrome b/b6 domain-containing protein [Mesorhizobium shangrilense]